MGKFFKKMAATECGRHLILFFVGMVIYVLYQMN